MERAPQIPAWFYMAGCQCRRDVSVGRNDDFVTLSNSGRSQGQFERIQSAVDPNAHVCPNEFRPSILERRDFNSVDKPT